MEGIPTVPHSAVLCILVRILTHLLAHKHNQGASRRYILCPESLLAMKHRRNAVALSALEAHWLPYSDVAALHCNHTKKCRRTISAPHQKDTVDKSIKKKMAKKKKTYNSRCSLVVTDPTTNLPVRSLSMGERTGSRIFFYLWSYVTELRANLQYIDTKK